jgi:hypothetical protein
MAAGQAAPVLCEQPGTPVRLRHRDLVDVGAGQGAIDGHILTELGLREKPDSQRCVLAVLAYLRV